MGMGAAIKLREDFDAASLRRFAGTAKDANQARRLLALAAVYDGQDREQAARVGGINRRTLADWVHRFNHKGPDGLIDAKAPGPEPKLSAEQKEALRKIVEDGPDPETDGVARWRCADLKRVIKERWDVDLAEVSIGRLLKELGFTHVSARPRHPAQDPNAIRAEKKLRVKRRCGAGWSAGRDAEGSVHRHAGRDLVPGRDAGRQKNGLVYQWAKKGTRPRQPKDQRYANAYVFSAVLPDRDIGAAVVMPRANTDAMQKHLDEISLNVATGAKAVLILDKAGWHTTGKLKVPANITLLFLPPVSPELNPTKTSPIAQTYLSNRVFESYEAIRDICCQVWRKLTDENGRIRGPVATGHGPLSVNNHEGWSDRSIPGWCKRKINPWHL